MNLAKNEAIAAVAKLVRTSGAYLFVIRILSLVGRVLTAILGFEGLQLGVAKTN